MVTWFVQIDGAKSPAEVVAITRDYLATWSPLDIARLPSTCRPGKLRDTTDLDSLHSCLVEEYRTTRASGDDLKALQQLTSFIVRTMIRIAELTQDGARGGSPGGPRDGPLKSSPAEK